MRHDHVQRGHRASRHRDRRASRRRDHHDRHDRRAFRRRDRHDRHDHRASRRRDRHDHRASRHRDHRDRQRQSEQYRLLLQPWHHQMMQLPLGVPTNPQSQDRLRTTHQTLPPSAPPLVLVDRHANRHLVQPALLMRYVRLQYVRPCLQESKRSRQREWALQPKRPLEKIV